MFSGIIEKTGRILEVIPAGERGRIFLVETKFTDLSLGESVSVDGVCLTVAETDITGRASFFISHETAEKTTFRNLEKGTSVNLERAVTPQTRLSGHLVQGHVDQVGKVQSLEPQSLSHELRILLPPALGRLCVEKGSIAVNGVSLTINYIQSCVENSTQSVVISINIVPFTWNQTALQRLQPGDPVNIEVDIIAKYVAKYLGNHFLKGNRDV